jgi:hypothetical protein
VHEKVTFSYNAARPTKTSTDVFIERIGVCRDFQHLAITPTRCMNILARYATGYIGDIRQPFRVPEISAPGIRFFLKADGSTLTRGTITRASLEFSLLRAAMQPMLPSRRVSVPRTSSNSALNRMR